MSKTSGSRMTSHHTRFPKENFFQMKLHHTAEHKQYCGFALYLYLHCANIFSFEISKDPVLSRTQASCIIYKNFFQRKRFFFHQNYETLKFTPHMLITAVNYTVHSGKIENGLICLNCSVC